ncbi:hypothetical protein GFK26_18025 [Variovorax paradoxus]|uniref:Uncharacterized protein n=1 Tax=Variovorax paradoxus TaxID=34073 RepID=A0A5Q0M6U8_VARPD|nr:hypothetical protein [Variovorax paradoxus]QFZ84527.1 hypothetical protein GFK26_18025 [Variovorax paradoxus]
MQEVLCTVHDLKFAFDIDRVRDLKDAAGKSIHPALMRCPVCSLQEVSRLRESLEKTTNQRDLLVRAIDLAKTLQPLS